jgi:spermidine/putrescine transport system substrate-binding protein
MKISIMSKRLLCVIGTVMLLSMLFFASGCKKEETASGSTDKTLYLYNWTYYTPESVIEKFEKEFGVKVVLDYFASNEDMFAKLKAGGSGYDIVFPSQDYTSIMMHEKMLLPIDKNRIPNLKYIDPMVLEKATYDPDMSWSVPYFMGASGIAVNTTKVSDYERSWNIFADDRLAGRMSMLDDMREVMGDALAYLGYSVNSTDDAELAEAQRLVNDKWKPNLVKFDAEGFAKSFSSGEFWVVQGYAEAVFEELESSRWDEVDFFLPPEGGPMYLDSMVIPKGAKHVELAHEFINFIHRPEVYAEFLDRFHFPASVHTEAGALMTVEPFYEGKDLANYELKNDLGADLEKYNEIWQSIRYVD